MAKKVVKSLVKKVAKSVAKKVVEKVAKVSTSKSYHLEIKVNDVVFKTDAKDIETALTEFVNSPAFPKGAKTTALIECSKGKESSKRIWRTKVGRRMFRIMGLKPSVVAILAEKLTNELS